MNKEKPAIATPLGRINLILQIFCVRLTMHKKEVANMNFFAYSIMYWVKPFTGWKSDYKFLGRTKRPKYIFLTDWL